MKKNLLVKVIIAFVMLTLIFSLAACKPKNNDVDDDPIEATAMEQLVGIIRGADGLVKALNEIDGNFNADVDISANRKTADNDDTYTLGVKGNLNTSSPELLVNFKSNGTENIALGYKSSKIYLKQPLTSLNKNADGSAAASSDAVLIDTTALNPSVTNLMTMLMKVLKDVNIPFDLEALASSLEGFLAEIGSLDELIVFKEISNGNRLEVADATIDLLTGVLLKDLLSGAVGTVADSLVNSVFDTDDGLDFIFGSNIFIEVYRNSAGTINGLKLGFTAEDETTGSITINLNKFNNSATDKATIAFGSEYAAKSLKLNVGASLPEKGVAALIDATATPDFSTNNKVLASGSLSFFNPSQSAPVDYYAIPAYFDGGAAYFNTAGAYNAIENMAGQGTVSAPANTLYKASVYKTTTTGTENTTIVDMINQEVAKLKAEFDAGSAASAEEESSEPSKGIMHMIYELLGGELTTTTKDDVTTYDEITEAKMLEQVDKLVGDYTRFDIYKKDATDTYAEAIKNITDLFDANKDWIIGTATSQASGNYGIFDWSKDNWNGGATLYKTGDDNDLLDAVNVFLCKSDDSDVDTTDISDFCNYYVSMLYYYMEKEMDPESSYVAAVEAADKALLIAKNIYLASNKDAAAKTALDNAKEAYKSAMEDVIFGTEATKDYTIANQFISGLIGVETTEDIATTNVLKNLIEGGLYVGVSCTKGQGLNGTLTIANNKDFGTIYLSLNGKISLTATAAVANIADVTNAIEIAKDFVAVVGTEEYAAEYKKIAKWEDGTKKVVVAEGPTQGDFIYEMNGENFVYDNRNVNAEALLDELFNMYMGYLQINYGYPVD